MANFDLLVIGGGVIGLGIARELRRRGVEKIVIVERGTTGGEASYAAAGMLAPNAENDTHDDFYDLCTASCEMYPEFASELLAETGVDIELEQSGTLYLAFTDEDSDELDRRYRWQSTTGVAVERLAANETLKAEPAISPIVRESLFYPSDWQVDNRKLLRALRRYADLHGIEFREHTNVRSLIIENGSVVGCRTETESVFANATILATGAWTSFIEINEELAPLDVKPIRGQMISFHPPDAMFRKVIYSPRGYLVPRLDGRILVGATVEDVGFDRSTTGEGIARLTSSALEISPLLSGFEIADKWAGLRPFAANGLPILGAFPGLDRLFVATGHYRNGILLAPITAKLIAEIVIDGASSKFLDVFGVRPKAKVLNAAE